MADSSHDIDQLCINTIRTLSMDAVQAANSGHPGTPMALAPVAYTLWQKFLNYDPSAPNWPNRDRFILSNGHASMLQYSLIHLTGIKNIDHKTHQVTDEPSLDLDQIKNFRQLGSRTPGHPEAEETTGIETTTGPLGQGAAVSVGMAIAQKWKAAHYGKPGFEELFNHRIYAILGDGCMMEGITSEAASLAGHLKLDNLTWIYDDNKISIDGDTALAFTEDVDARFRAYDWNVIRVETQDGNDIDQITEALEAAKNLKGKPTLISLRTIIGYGAPTLAGTETAHGSPLGDKEIAGAKKFYGWPEDKKFYVPDGVTAHFDETFGKRGQDEHAKWNKLFSDYKSRHADLAQEIETMEKRGMPKNWDAGISTFDADEKGLATRKSSGQVINELGKNVPWLVGGSADLNPSTFTYLKEMGEFTPDNPGGRNIRFGVREHAMTAIMTGLSMSKLRGYGSSFLVFTDYARGAIRLSAVQHCPSLHIYTHDSLGVGEDGPTHQPIEHLASLRAIPNLIVIRPGDANEVAEAYKAAMLTTHNPVLLALTRQNVPTLDRSKYAPAEGLQKGGYILGDAEGGKPDVILIGTGSEVSLCVAAYEKLTSEGVKARVVSLPSWELFENQTQAYRDEVLPPEITNRVSVEMATTFGWERYATTKGTIIGMTTFGQSAPAKEVMKAFGFTVDHVVDAAKKLLG